MAPGISDVGNHAVRICAISSAAASIVFSFIGIILIGAIHPARRRFRHQLVFVLILLDLLKAIMIMAYSGGQIQEWGLLEYHWSHSSVNAIGWFTALSVEAADLIILYMAIHIFLVVFKGKLPRWLLFQGRGPFTLLKLKLFKNQELNSSSKFSPNSDSNSFKSKRKSNAQSRNGADRNKEEGLYNARHTIFLSVAIISIVVASCGLIKGYNNSTYWAFFKTKDGLWIFTWVFRYFIVTVIFIIYISIYIFVMMEYKKMSREMYVTSHQHKESELFKTTFGDSLWYKLGQYTLMLIFPDVRISAKLHGQDLNTETDIRNIERLKNESNNNKHNNQHCLNFHSHRSSSISVPPPVVIHANKVNRTNMELTTQHIQELINDESMIKFERRRIQILNQMKLVFIYPVSYSFLWLFPFIKQVILWRGNDNSLRLWIEAPAAFFQAFSAVVDVTVLMAREKPWRLNTPPLNDSDYTLKHNWRHYLSFLPIFKPYKREKIPVTDTTTTTTTGITTKTTTSQNNILDSMKGSVLPTTPLENNRHRETWQSSYESSRGFSETKSGSFFENQQLLDHGDDEYNNSNNGNNDTGSNHFGGDGDGDGVGDGDGGDLDDGKKEDLLEFLNSDPREYENVKYKKEKSNDKRRGSYNPVNWNLNIFENPNKIEKVQRDHVIDEDISDAGDEEEEEEEEEGEEEEEEEVDLKGFLNMSSIA